MTGETAANRRPAIFNDLSAGVVVFLVALPLCLGIALACGAPLFAGVISGIVGGLVVALLSGSEVSVSGPTAGLTVVVATGIAQCGSYQVFLCAVVFAGMMQLLLAIMRAGAVASLIPNSVITGMLAAIGAIIILKQIPHALGRDADYEGDLSFWQITDKENTFSEIVRAVLSFSPGVLIISFLSIAILMSWTRLNSIAPRLTKLLPGPLVAIIVGITINQIYASYFPSLYIAANAGHLVSLPVAPSFIAFFGQFQLPQFDSSHLGHIASTGLMIAIAASIESMLNVEAGDKIDPYRRSSNPNRELLAQGVGNIVSGLLGGLPLTSVVLRTSANIYAGARTRMSVVVHGALLLGAVALIPGILNLIPLGTLAAILIVVGARLVSVRLFRLMYKRGIDQFLPFITTIVAIVFSDVLTGVVAGLSVSMFFVVKSNYHSAITVVNEGDQYLIRFTKDVSFANKIRLKKELSRIPDRCSLLIDGRSAVFIDKDIYEVIEDFRHNAQFRGIKIKLENLESKTVRLFGDPK